MSAVDGSLMVYGIEGLRIVDGSIMPTITTGNTMAPRGAFRRRDTSLSRH